MPVLRVGGERHVGQAHAGVDGEIVDPLLALLDQRVAIDFPGELDGVAVALLQRLVDRHGADRHRRIAQDPLARVVDVAAGGEVHDGVAAPADRPHHLLHLLLHGRGDGRVADIGVDLHQEVAADDHRLKLGVIDVGRDDGAAARDLVAHELRRDVLRDGGAEALAVSDGGLGACKRRRAAEVLAMRDVDHLLGDDAGLRELVLRHRLARQPAQRHRLVREIARQVLARDVAVVLRLDVAAGVLLDAAALAHPGLADARQALFHVDGGVRVGVGAGGVVDAEGFLGGALGERDLAERHAHVGVALGRGVHLGRRR